MTKLPLTQEVYDAIKAGFALPELEMYAFRRAFENNAAEAMREYRKIPAVAAQPDAFLDGVELLSCVCLIFSADTDREYQNDLARYDAKAHKLNQKYGDIVLTHAEVKESRDGAYGLIGSRVVPFAHITTTVFPSGKTNVETPRADVESADEETRRQFEFTED